MALLSGNHHATSGSCPAVGATMSGLVSQAARWSTSAKKCLTAGTVSIVLLGLNEIASAAVVPIFSVNPDTIIAGEQAVLDVVLNLSPDAGNFNAQFYSGSVTLNSGLGSAQTFMISAGGTSQAFSFAFAYPFQGDFTPSLAFSATYSQQYQSYQITGYTQVWVPSGFYQYYSCGFHTCSRWIDTSHYESRPVYDYVTLTRYSVFEGEVFGSLHVDASNDAAIGQTPVPGALPLFASGLAGFGMLSWRRRRKSVANR